MNDLHILTRPEEPRPSRKPKPKEEVQDSWFPLILLPLILFCWFVRDVMPTPFDRGTLFWYQQTMRDPTLHKFFLPLAALLLLGSVLVDFMPSKMRTALIIDGVLATAFMITGLMFYR